MRLISPTAMQASFSENTEEVVCFLLEIQYSDTETFYFTNNNQEVVHQSNTYIPYRFDLSLPDEADKNRNEVELKIDNIDGRLLEAILGVDEEIKIRFKVVLFSTPEFIEAGPFNFKMNKVTWNATDIVSTLIAEDILLSAYPGYNVNPSTHPAAF